MPTEAEWRQIQASFENDIAATQAPLPLLAHYTTLDNLEKIIRDKHLWFSHPLVMNDHDEILHGLGMAIELIQQSENLQLALGPAKFKMFSRLLGVYAFSYRGGHFNKTYIFCLSRHGENDKDGLLSMWRGYGGRGSGAAIVFDFNKLGDLPHVPIVISEVVYREELDLWEWVSRLIDKLLLAIGRYDMQQEDMPELADTIFDRIRLAAIFSKHSGFSEEKEWRAVYMPERDTQRLYHRFFDYHNGPRGLEPKFKLSLAAGNGWAPKGVTVESLIDRIILGPSRPSDLVEPTAKLMLSKASNTPLKVHASTIPYRDQP